MNSAIARWLVFTLLNLGIIGFYLYRAYEIRRDYDASRPPIPFLILGHVSLVLAVIGFTMPSAPYLLRLFVPLFFHCATLFTYISQFWVVYGHNIQFWKDKRFVIATIGSLITVFINYLRGSDLSFFIGKAPMNLTMPYYLAHGLGFALSTYLCFLVFRMFWNDFIDSDDYTYAARRFIGASSFLVALVCALTLLCNLVLATFTGELYRQQINQIYFILMPIHSLLMALTLLPQPVFVFFSRPLRRLSQDNTERYKEEIAYLHRNLSRVVFNIYKVDKHVLHPTRTLLETETMLRMAVSHLKPKMTDLVSHEAKFLLQLERRGTILYQAGPYRVHRGGLKHIVRVARQLRQLERDFIRGGVDAQTERHQAGSHIDVPSSQPAR